MFIEKEVKRKKERSGNGEEIKEKKERKKKRKERKKVGSKARKNNGE